MSDTDFTDYGPAVARVGARLVETGVGGRVEIADRPDPDAPKRTIRGARRYDPVRSACVPAWMQAAAERFRDDVALADGVRDGERVHVSSSGSAHGPAAAQIDAQTRAREAFQAIRDGECGAEAADAVRCMVLAGVPIEGYEAGRRLRRGEGRARLTVGLVRLAAHYGFGE